MSYEDIKAEVAFLPTFEQQKLYKWLEEIINPALLFLTAPVQEDLPPWEETWVRKDLYELNEDQVRKYVEFRGLKLEERELMPGSGKYKTNVVKIMTGPCPFHTECLGGITVQVSFSGYWETDCPYFVVEKGLHGGSLRGLEMRLTHCDFETACASVKEIVEAGPLIKYEG